MFALNSHNIEETIFDLEKIVLPVLEAKVEFGEKNHGCAGYGICSIVAQAETGFEVNSKCCRTVVYLMPEEKDQIRFIFPKEEMCKNIYRKYFSSGHFMVREDFLLSRPITEELGVEKRLLLVGSYPVYEDSDLIEVIM